jgi:hypothetical protein
MGNVLVQPTSPSPSSLLQPAALPRRSLPAPANHSFPSFARTQVDRFKMKSSLALAAVGLAARAAAQVSACATLTTLFPACAVSWSGGSTKESNRQLTCDDRPAASSPPPRPWDAPTASTLSVSLPLPSSHDPFPLSSILSSTSSETFPDTPRPLRPDLVGRHPEPRR